MPSPARPRMTSSTSPTISGSRAEVGSSNSITRGSIASARAMATRCCCPPDSWAGYLATWSARPTRSRRRRAVRSALSRSHRRTLSGARVTFSSTVLWGNRLNCWNTMPTSRRMSCSSVGILRRGPVEGPRAMPSTSIEPEPNRSSPLMQRISVDLPEPLAPMITTTSPLATDRSTSWKDLDLAVGLVQAADRDDGGLCPAPRRPSHRRALDRLKRRSSDRTPRLAGMPMAR